MSAQTPKSNRSIPTPEKPSDVSPSTITKEDATPSSGVGNKGFKYLKFISYLQIIGIILVVLGHSFHQYPDGMNGQSLWLYRLLYNVRMPMFTFVSGYLMYYTSFVAYRHKRTWSAFAKNKTMRLLLPYFTLSLITFVPRASLSMIADDAVEMSVAVLVRSLFDADRMVIPYFWFLHMSFILLVGTYLVLIISAKYKLRMDYAIFAMIVLFVVLPFLDIDYTSIFAIRDVVRLGIYFTLGIAYCHYATALDKFLHISSVSTALFCGILWIALFTVFEGESAERLISVLGITSFVSLSHILEDKNIRILDHLQGANYIIFLLSWYVNVATQQVLAHFVELPWWVHTVLSLFGGIYIPYLGLKYLQKHSDSRWSRFTAMLLGQRLRER